jgi:hypothetical protein
MTDGKTHAQTVRSALHAVLDNENRWLEMSPDASDDYEKAELWASTARLRRSKVERLEKQLAESVLDPETQQ